MENNQAHSGESSGVRRMAVLKRGPQKTPPWSTGLKEGRRGGSRGDVRGRVFQERRTTAKTLSWERVQHVRADEGPGREGPGQGRGVGVGRCGGLRASVRPRLSLFKKEEF